MNPREAPACVLARARSIARTTDDDAASATILALADEVAAYRTLLGDICGRHVDVAPAEAVDMALGHRRAG